MSDELKPPRHRHEATLTVGANSVSDLARKLRVVANDLEYQNRDEARDVHSSGGWSLKVDHDPSMTEERFERELMAWFDARRAARK